MKIVFPDGFGNALTGIAVSKEHARQTIERPDRTEVFRQDGDDMELRFFVRAIPGSRAHTSILAYGRVDDASRDTLTVLNAFRYYPDLCEDSGAQRPTDLLRAIAERFGFEIEIQGRCTRFFAHGVLQSNLHAGKDTPVMMALEVGKKPFLQELLMKPPEQTDQTFIVSLAYCLDVDRYAQWVRSHGA
jgi:hypothetical protein